MGLLRLFFALCVVFVHAYPVFGFGGISGPAVNSFFVISGFYMAFILTEKYTGKNGAYRLFITNRFLRIYPLYWTILILAFSFSLYKFFFFPQQDSYIRLLLDFLSKSPYLFFEIVMTVWRNISLIFTTDYFRHNFTDPGYLLIQPAWTLQVELLFYLFVPFLIKIKTPFIIFLACIFTIVTFGYIDRVSPNDSRVSLIFVTRFVFFLFGILAYKLYTLIKKKHVSPKISQFVFIIFPLFALTFQSFFVKVLRSMPQLQFLYLFYYLLLMVALAFIFLYSKDKKWDSAIGELSYPVYISHQLVFKVVTAGPLVQKNHDLTMILTLAATLVFSYLMAKIIERPIDVIRQNRLRK